MVGDKTRHRSGGVRGPLRKIPKIEVGRAVAVNWLDIITEPNWVSKEEFVEQEPIECITIGIWMPPGQRCIHIASNINENSCDGTTIPIGCVLRIKVIGHA